MEDKRAVTFGRLVVIAGWLAIFCIFGFRTIFAILAAPIGRTFGWAQATVTLGFSIMMLMYAIFAFISGFMLDKWGNRPAYLVAAIFGALGFGLCSQIGNNPIAFYVTFGVMGGICTGMLWVSSTAAIRKWYVGKQYSSKYGLAFMGGPVAQLVLGQTVKSMLASGGAKMKEALDVAATAAGHVAGTDAYVAFAEAWNKANPDETWRTCLIMLACVTVVFLVIGIFFCRREPEYYGYRPFGSAPAAPAAAGGPAPVKARAWTLGEAFSTVAAWMAIVAFLVCMLSEFLIWGKVVDIWSEILALPQVLATGLTAGTPEYIAALNKASADPVIRSQATNMYLVVGGVGIFSIPLMGVIADKIVGICPNELIGRKRVLMLGAFYGLLAGIILLIQYKTQINFLGYVAAILFAFFWGITPGNTVGYLGAVYGGATLGKIWGLSTMIVMGIGPFTGPLLAASLKDSFGSFIPGVVVAIIGFALGVILSSLLPGKPYPPKYAEPAA